jgi:predicted transcriptional regulator
LEQAEPNMSKTLPVTVRLPLELNQQVADIAQALDRPKSWVIEQAIKDFVAVQAWHLAAIDEGIRAANAGQVVAHDDVAAWVRSWGKPDELPMPECK